MTEKNIIKRLFRHLIFPIFKGSSTIRKGYEPYRVSTQEWEQQYSIGKWDYMNELKELPRYSIIAGYFQFFKYGGAILDLGCGPGILQDKIGKHAYCRYVGIDISSEAIRQASEKEDDKTTFICADITTYTPEESFDMIVFNEILYYLDTPLDVVKRYEHFVKSNGLFIVSMFVSQTQKPVRIWEQLQHTYSFADETVSINKNWGQSWDCKVLSPFASDEKLRI